MHSDYSDLINKIKVTGDYVERLTRIEDNMRECVCNGLVENKALEILEKCINDINSIYINSEWKSTKLEVELNEKPVNPIKWLIQEQQR